MKKILPVILFFFGIFTRQAFASPQITVKSFPSSITAGQEFTAIFEASSIDLSSTYYAKALGGADLTEVDTWNGEWLQQNSAWANMPTFVTTSESSVSASIKARFDPAAQSGTKQFEIRIRKTSESSNFDSAIVSISVVAATPSPTSSPTTTPAPTQAPTTAPTAAPTPTPTKTPTPVATKSPTPKSTKTPSPSPEILGEATFESLPTATAEATEQPVESSEKKIPFLPIVLIVAGVLMMGFAGFRLYTGRSESTDTQAP